MITPRWPSIETSTLERLTMSLLSDMRGFDRSPSDRVVAIVPLYASDAVEMIAGIARECRECNACTSLHIIGLRCSLSEAVSGKQVADHSEAERKAIKSLFPLTLSELEVTYSLIEDHTIGGSPIGFTLDTLAQYLTLILSALSWNYQAVITPALVRDFHGHNLAIGAAMLRYDTSRSIKIMLSAALLKILNSSGVNQTDIDAEKIARMAEECIGDTKSFYLRFYHDVIIGAYRRGAPLAEIIETMGNEVRKVFDAFSGNIAALISATSLTLPEKEAILTRILQGDVAVIADDAIIIHTNTATDFTAVDADISGLETRREKLSAEAERISAGLLRDRRRRRELADRIKSTEEQITQLRRNRDEAVLSSRTAELWIDCHKQFMERSSRLLRKLGDLIENVKTRIDEINTTIPGDPKASPVVFNLTDASRLTEFIANHLTGITSGIDFRQILKAYLIDGTPFEELLSDTESQICDTISRLFDSFSLAEYLMGQDYPYLDNTDITTELRRLASASQPLGRNSAPDLSKTEIIDFVGVEPGRMRAWKAAYECVLPSSATHISTGDPGEIFLITVQPIPLEYCR